VLRTFDLDEEIPRVTINGREFWHDVARDKLLPVIAGGAGAPPPPDTPAPPPPAPAPAPTPAPQPDLAALQAVIDEAKTSGQTEAQTTLLKTLGFDKIDDLQTFVTAKRKEETDRRQAARHRSARSARRIVT
jgi:hypothetical protein